MRRRAALLLAARASPAWALSGVGWQHAAWAAAAGAVGLTTGCGFQLRSAPQMPFQRLALGGFAPRSPMAAALRRSLAPGVQVVEAAAQAEVLLMALTDVRERNVTVSTVAGQVRELQLRARLKFRVQRPDGRELLPPAELLLVRDMSYSETQALAKEQEEAQLWREMESDIALQVARRLSAVRL